jgi:hypothetical protein
MASKEVNNYDNFFDIFDIPSWNLKNASFDEKDLSRKIHIKKYGCASIKIEYDGILYFKFHFINPKTKANLDYVNLNMIRLYDSYFNIFIT